MAKLKTILIVDDEHEVLDVLKELLNEYAENILGALNGKAALDLLESHIVDCIISDINMAPINGPEFLKKVIEKQLGHVPFLFYTAHGTEEHLQQVDLSKVTAIVSKPSFDRLETELLKIINAPA